MNPNERRLNRLVFWSVALLDFALSFGTGRPTTFRIEDITQLLPSQEDIWPDGAPAGMPRSPFPFAAKQMMAYGPLITLLNGSHKNKAEWKVQFQAAWSKAVEDYHDLPEDMQWSATKCVSCDAQADQSACKSKREPSKVRSSCTSTSGCTRSSWV